MLLSILLLPLVQAPVSTDASLLSIVPEDAFAIAHCKDFAAFRTRSEQNDWIRLLGSQHGEPFLMDFAREFRNETGGEMDGLLAVARELQGEVVFFASERVAGFVADPGAGRTTLTEVMRDWLPKEGASERRTVEMSDGSVELVAWPEGWRGGHYAAFVDHPLALALYSGDDSDAVMAALTKGVSGLGTDTRAPIVTAYLANGGGQGNGVEAFIDFTPFVDGFDSSLKSMVKSILPDPANLLGLEAGTWLHVATDVFPGTSIEVTGRLNLPENTLASELADTFKPLSNTLSVDLPQGVWGLWALNWDLKLFYQRARAAYEEKHGKGLEVIDTGIQAAKDMADVDPIEDVLNQLAGEFAFYAVEPPQQLTGDMFEELLMLGFQAGLEDGGAFETALEKLLDFGGLATVFELEEIAGVDAYVMDSDDDFNGGISILPRAITIALSRQVLESSLRALTRMEGASLSGSRMAAAIDESSGACFFASAEMTPLRRYWLPEMKADIHLPPLIEGGAARDPFDSQLVITAQRTAKGFDFRFTTR